MTAYSQAMWFRRREVFGKAIRANGWIIDHRPGDTTKHMVSIWNAAGAGMTFRGFSWGYRGEGPNGLADVLTDARLFETRDEALEFVAHQPSRRWWRLLEGTAG